MVDLSIKSFFNYCYKNKSNFKAFNENFQIENKNNKNIFLINQFLLNLFLVCLKLITIIILSYLIIKKFKIYFIFRKFFIE